MVKDALDISANSTKDAIAEANEQMGLSSSGPLPAQVDALCKALGL